MAADKVVMVAIDESEFSRYALEWSIDTSIISSSNQRVILIIAQPYPDIAYLTAASYGAPPPELVQSVQQHQKKMSHDLLNKAKDLCAEHGIVAETISETGDPKEVICEAAEKLGVSLLIVGSHGKGALQRAFLGSVSNYCVHNAKCPVLVVKKPAST